MVAAAPSREGSLCPSVRCYIFSPAVVSGAMFPSLILQLLPTLFPWSPWESLCSCSSASSGFTGSQSNHHPCLLRHLQQAGQVSCSVTECGWAPLFKMLGVILNPLSLYYLFTVCLLNILCKEEICLWVKVISHVFSYTMWLEFTVDGMVYDFCVILYSSVKPFVQQAYPIQPSVTAPISGNSSIYTVL